MAKNVFAQMRRHKKGVALIITLAVLTLLALLGITFSMLSGIERGLTRNYVDYVRAKIVANNGVDDAIFKLRYCFEDSANSTAPDQFAAIFATSDAYTGTPSNTTFCQSWTYRADNGGAQATASGWTGGNSPNFTTPLENAVIPSFVYVNNYGWPYPIKINGVLTYFSGFMDTSTYGGYSDVYSLKVLDCSGMLYINDGLLAGPNSPTTLNMQRMLNVLGGLPTVGVNGLGDLIIGKRPQNGWRDKYQLVNSGLLTKAQFNVVKNFITTYSWVDNNVVNPVPLSSTVLSQYPYADTAKTKNIGQAYYRQFKVNVPNSSTNPTSFSQVTESVYRYGDSPAGRSVNGLVVYPATALVSSLAGTAPPMQWYPTAAGAPDDCGNIVWGYDELNPVWIETVARAPVNINTAPYEVLETLLSNLQGFFMVERRRDAPLRTTPAKHADCSPYYAINTGYGQGVEGYAWLGQQFQYGSLYGPYTDAPYSTPSGSAYVYTNSSIISSAYSSNPNSSPMTKNGIDALGYLYSTVPIVPPSGVTGSGTSILASQIAAEMIYCRNYQLSPITGIDYRYNPAVPGSPGNPNVWWAGPFKTWRQFNRFVDALVWKPTEPNGNFPTLSDGTIIGSSCLFVDNRSRMYYDYAFSDTDLDEHEINSPIQQQYASQAIADTLKANFNPNCHLNELNPDANIFTMVDKTDLVCNSTEFTFTPMGYFEIECLARILQPTNTNLSSGVPADKSMNDTFNTSLYNPGGIYNPVSSPDNIVRAQKRVSAVIKLFDVYRETTQKDFYGGNTPQLGSSAMPDRKNAQTAPLMATNSNYALELGPEPAQGNLGVPDPSNDGPPNNYDPNKNIYLPNGVEYDGYLTLSTYGADYDKWRDGGGNALKKGTYTSSLGLPEGSGPYPPPVPWTFGNEENSSVIHSHFQLDTHSHYNASVDDLGSTKYRKDMAWGLAVYSAWNAPAAGQSASSSYRGWGYPVPTYYGSINNIYGWPVTAGMGTRPSGIASPGTDSFYDNTPLTSADGNPLDYNDKMSYTTGDPFAPGGSKGNPYNPDYSYWYGNKDLAQLKAQDPKSTNGGVGCYPKVELADNSPAPTEWNLYPNQSAPYGPYEFYDSGNNAAPTNSIGRYRLAHSFRLPPYTSTTTALPTYEIIAPSNLRKDGVYVERNSGIAYWIDEGVSWDSMHGAISMWVKPGFFPEMSGKPRVWFSASRWHYQGSEYGYITASGGYNPTAFGLFFLPAHASLDNGAHVTEDITSAEPEENNLININSGNPYQYIPPGGTITNQRGGVGRFAPCSLGFGFGFHDSAGYNADFDDPYSPDPALFNLGNVTDSNDPAKVGHTGLGWLFNSSNPNSYYGKAPNTPLSAADTQTLNGMFYDSSGNPTATYKSLQFMDPNLSADIPYNNYTAGGVNNLRILLTTTSTNVVLGGIEGGYISPTLNHIGHNDRYPGGPGTPPSGYNTFTTAGTNYFISDRTVPGSSSTNQYTTQTLSAYERPNYLKAHQWTNIIAKWTIPKRAMYANATNGAIPGRWIWNMWVNGQDFRVTPTVAGGSTVPDESKLTEDNSLVSYNGGISYPYRRPHFSVQSFMQANGLQSRFSPTPGNFNPAPPTMPEVTMSTTTTPVQVGTETFTKQVQSGTTTVTVYKTTYEEVGENVSYPVIEWVAESSPSDEQVLDHYDTETYDIQVLDHYDTIPNPNPQGQVPVYDWIPQAPVPGPITGYGPPVDTGVPNMVWVPSGTTHPVQQTVQTGWTTVYVWDPVSEQEVPQQQAVYGQVTVQVPDPPVQVQQGDIMAQGAPIYGPPVTPPPVLGPTGQTQLDPNWTPTIQKPVYRTDTVTVQIPVYKTITVQNTVWVPTIVWQTTSVPSYQLVTQPFTETVPNYVTQTVTQPIMKNEVTTNPQTGTVTTAQMWQVADTPNISGNPPYVIANCIRLGETSYNGFKYFSRNYSADATIDEFYLWKEGEGANAAPGAVTDPTTLKDNTVDYATFANGFGGSGSPNINNAFKLWYKGRYFRPDFSNPTASSGGTGPSVPQSYTNLPATQGPDPDVGYIWDDGTQTNTAISYWPGYESQFKSGPTKITITKPDSLGKMQLVGGVVKGSTRGLPASSTVRPNNGGSFSFTTTAASAPVTGSFRIFGLSWTWYGENVLDVVPPTFVAPAGHSILGAPYLLDYKNFLPSNILGTPYVIMPAVVVSLIIYNNNLSGGLAGGVEYGTSTDRNAAGINFFNIPYYGWNGAEKSKAGNTILYKDLGAFAPTTIQDPTYANKPNVPISVPNSANIKYRVQFLLSDSNGGTSYDPNNSILLTSPVFDDITFYLDAGEQIMSYTIVE